MQWIKPGTNLDFVGKKNIALAISAVIIIIGIVSMVSKGGLRLGIDFSGGTEVHVRFAKPVEADDVRKATEAAKLGEPTVQSIGQPGDNEYLVRVSALGEATASPAAAIVEALNKQFGAESFTVLREDAVGPRAGQDLRAQGLYAILLSFLGILIYVAIRFDFKFGVGSIVALLHDTLIVLAAFSLFNKEITLTVIAAILTVIGYSMNDTVIVFDRIRENMRTMRQKKFSEVVNKSINETLSRTILTSLTMLLVTATLYLFGGSVLNDFAFTLLIGVFAGTYSSIYIAAPVVIGWQKDKVVAGTRRKK